MPDDHLTTRAPRSIASLIASHGFAVKAVGYGQCDVPGCRCTVRSRSPWTYTVGLTAASLPELVVMGLAPGAAHFAVTWVVERRRAGRVLPLEEPFLIDGAPAKLLPVPDDWVLADPSRMAAWFEYFGVDTSSPRLPKVQQLVWPDATDRFPDDPRCAEWVVRDQPILRAAPLHHPPRSVGPDHRHRRSRARR